MEWVDYLQNVQNVSTGGDQQKISSSDKKDEDVVDKELYKALGEEGLTIDNEKFLLAASTLLKSSYTDSLVPGQNVQKLIALKRYANQLKLNKSLYDKAEEHVRTNNVGDDFAMTSDGKVYVLEASESGNVLQLNTVKIETLSNNQNKYIPLTNNQLLEVRDKGQIGGTIVKDMVFNSSVLRDVTSAIGMEDVMKTVDDVIKRYGAMKNSGHEMRVGKDVGEGLEGLYKITVEKTNTIISPEVAKAAAKFIYTNLNTNAKNVLKLNAEMNGSNVLDYLVYTITAAADTTYSPELKKTLDELEKDKAEKDTAKTTNRSFINTVVLGEAVETVDVKISGKEGTRINVPSQVYGFRDEQGNNVGMNNLEVLFTQEDNSIGNVVDKNSISIGNTLVGSSEIYKLVYDGTSTLNRMRLPIDEDVYAATGKIKPDLDALEKFEKFKKWKKDNPNASAQEQALKIQELKINVQYDSNTDSWKFRNTHLFLTTNGYVSKEVIDISKSDLQFLSHLDDATREQIVDVYENYVNYGQASTDKNKKRANSIDLFGFFDWKDAANIYKGMIFMPVLGKGTEYIANNNEIVPKSDYINITNQRNTQEMQRNFRNNF